MTTEQGTLSRDQHDGDVVGGAGVGAGDGSVGLCKHVQACCFPVSVCLRAGKTQAERPSYITRLTFRTLGY